MPIPEPRDLAATRGILAGWLAGNLGVDRAEVGPIQGPALTGCSNETVLCEATYTRRGREVTEGFVVRVKPTAHTTCGRIPATGRRGLNRSAISLPEGERPNTLSPSNQR